MADAIADGLKRLAARTVDVVSREELDARLRAAEQAGRPLRVKFGADPSAPDLHIGHLVALNKLREFQDLVHTVVFIIGDTTAMIGDPSGRSQTRKPMSRDGVERNALTYQEQVFLVLDRDRTEVRFNSEWCGGLDFEGVLKLSAQVTIAQILARDDFARRYEANQPISLIEFMYPLIQAYDSVQVEADVEVGGTDQLFNLLLGREMQKAFGQAPQIVMTMPLVEGLDGVQKMSKSLGNYIGVTESPRDMFGKMMSADDALMWRYADLSLCLDADRIEAWKALHPREAKDRIATALVDRFHGAGAGAAASEEFSRVFRERELPSEIPDIVIPEGDLTEDGRIGVLTLLVLGGLAASNSEARRLVQQGAVRIDGAKIDDPKAFIVPVDGAVVRCGRRGFGRIARSMQG